MSGWTSVAGFENFLADLAANEEKAHAREAVVPPAASRQTAQLITQILDEVANAAVLIAVSSAIANATEKGSLAVQRSSIAVYAPVQTSFFDSLTAALPGSGAKLEVCRAVQAYCARVAFARRMILSFTRSDDVGALGVGGGHDAGGLSVDAEPLADAWRRACRATIDCIAALESVLAADRSEQSQANAFVLDLLRNAATGGCPCLDLDGRVTIPGWAERRREARNCVQLAATAQIGSRIIPVMIRDASPAGLGLESRHIAEPGERIVVRMPGDRQLAGAVAWSDGQRIGVRLDQRLKAGDPLLGA